jgi:hypothetical protein
MIRTVLMDAAKEADLKIKLRPSAATPSVSVGTDRECLEIVAVFDLSFARSLFLLFALLHRLISRLAVAPIVAQAPRRLWQGSRQHREQEEVGKYQAVVHRAD